MDTLLLYRSLQAGEQQDEGLEKAYKGRGSAAEGTVYILPFHDEHYEFLQWLVSEIAAMKGEAAVVSIEKIDTMKDTEIIAHFNKQRVNDYQTTEKALDDLERRLSSIQKGAKAQNIKVYQSSSTRSSRPLKKSNELISSLQERSGIRREDKSAAG